jgi:hypothetical protein
MAISVEERAAYSPLTGRPTFTWPDGKKLASRSKLVTQQLPKKRDVRGAFPLLRPPMLVAEIDSGFVRVQREFPELGRR